MCKYEEMILGDGEKTPETGQQPYKKHLHTQKEGNVSEGILPSFLESKRRGGEKRFQSCKNVLTEPYNKVRATEDFWVRKIVLDAFFYPGESSVES